MAAISRGHVLTSAFSKFSSARQVQSRTLYAVQRLQTKLSTENDKSRTLLPRSFELQLNSSIKSAPRFYVPVSYKSFVANGESLDVSESDEEGDEDFKKSNLDNHDLSEQVKSQLRSKGITELFPVQYETLKPTLDGKDVIVQARTGTGKTMSFAIPLVELLRNKKTTEPGRPPKAIVLTPTRELAKQVCDDIMSIASNLKVLPIYGGAPYGPQLAGLERGVDVIVGTPGRINDLMGKGLRLDQLEHVILDEVDNMLDKGFAEQIESILANTYDQALIRPQSMVYSATMPPWIFRSLKRYMKGDYVHVNLVGKDTTKTSTTVEHISIKCSRYETRSLIHYVINKFSQVNGGRALIFSETKSGASQIASYLDGIKAGVLHGDLSQSQRDVAIRQFKNGRLSVLVATDVAARGLDIPDVDLVVQLEPPRNIESYIHRSGRTGRANKSGVSILIYERHRDLRNVEDQANITFKEMPLPTEEELIEARVEVMRERLNKVPQATVDKLSDFAQSIIDSNGATPALAAAIALLTNQRSLQGNLSGRDSRPFTSQSREGWYGNSRNRYDTDDSDFPNHKMRSLYSKIKSRNRDSSNDQFWGKGDQYDVSYKRKSLSDSNISSFRRHRSSRFDGEDD